MLPVEPVMDAIATDERNGSIGITSEALAHVLEEAGRANLSSPLRLLLGVASSKEFRMTVGPTPLISPPERTAAETVAFDRTRAPYASRNRQPAAG